MAKVKCYNKKCGKGYESSDSDDVEGFGRCPACKMNQNIIFETEKILAKKRASNPRVEIEPFDKRFPEGVPINARNLGVFR